MAAAAHLPPSHLPTSSPWQFGDPLAKVARAVQCAFKQTKGGQDNLVVYLKSFKDIASLKEKKIQVEFHSDENRRGERGCSAMLAKPFLCKVTRAEFPSFLLPQSDHLRVIQQLLLVLVFTAVTLEWSAVLLLCLDPIFGMLPFIEPVSVPTVVLATFDKFSLSLDGILDSEKMMGCCQILRNHALHHVRKHCQ